VVLTGIIGVWSLLRAPGLPRTLVWNSVAVVLAAAVTGLVWRGFLRERTHIGIGWAAPGVVFAHVLDATTTGVGLEILGTTEQNPVSATVISLGDAVAAGVGVVLFLALKTILASVLVLLSSPSIGTSREQVSILALGGGVGLAPAIHNIVLFTLTVG
jgi:uncharacterized membrane protein